MARALKGNFARSLKWKKGIDSPIVHQAEGEEGERDRRNVVRGHLLISGLGKVKKEIRHSRERRSEKGEWEMKKGSGISSPDTRILSKVGSKPSIGAFRPRKKGATCRKQVESLDNKWVD